MGPKINLPYPLPSQTPEQWFAEEEGRPPLTVCTTWWAFLTALLVGTRFIPSGQTPLDARSEHKSTSADSGTHPFSTGNRRPVVPQCRAPFKKASAHTLTRVVENAVRPTRGINSQILCIGRQRNRTVEIVDRTRPTGIRIRTRAFVVERGNGGARRGGRSRAGKGRR